MASSCLQRRGLRTADTVSLCIALASSGVLGQIQLQQRLGTVVSGWAVCLAGAWGVIAKGKRGEWVVVDHWQSLP